MRKDRICALIESNHEICLSQAWRLCTLPRWNRPKRLAKVGLYFVTCVTMRYSRHHDKRGGFTATAAANHRAVIDVALRITPSATVSHSTLFSAARASLKRPANSNSVQERKYDPFFFLLERNFAPVGAEQLVLPPLRC